MSRFGKLFETSEHPQSPGDGDIAPVEDAPTQTSKGATTQQYSKASRRKDKSPDIRHDEHSSTQTSDGVKTQIYTSPTLQTDDNASSQPAERSDMQISDGVKEQIRKSSTLQTSDNGSSQPSESSDTQISDSMETQKWNKASTQKDESPVYRVAENSDVPGGGRAKRGKRSDPAYEQVTAYIRKETYRQVKMRLLAQDGGDFSTLMQELLEAWLTRE